MPLFTSLLHNSDHDQAFVTPLGKSSVDESYQNFVGLYQGAITPSPAVRESIEGSDLVIHVGRFPTDSNTGGWSGKIQTANTIVLHPEYVSVRDENWRPLSFVPIIKKLARALKEKQAIQLPEKWWKSVSTVIWPMHSQSY
jgi:pyruvate decarboxylase